MHHTVIAAVALLVAVATVAIRLRPRRKRSSRGSLALPALVGARLGKGQAAGAAAGARPRLGSCLRFACSKRGSPHSTVLIAHVTRRSSTGP